MFDLLGILIWFICIILIGWSVLSLICKKNLLSLTERAAMSYGIGLGLVALEMLILSFFNIKFNVISILIWWVPLVGWVLLSDFRDRRFIFSKSEIEKKKPFSWVEKVFVFGISFEIFYAFFRALIKPIESYDAIATYAIRSKIFYLARSIPQDFFYSLSLLFPHPDYPLNIPLSETFVYLFLGSLNDQLVKVIFPLYFVAILGILYSSIRRFSSRANALVFTFMLATIPQFNHFATNAYHDVPLSYYCFTGTLFLLYWFKDRSTSGFLYISAIMTALSAWTKNEGFVYCVANITLLAIFLSLNRRNIRVMDICNGFLYMGIILLILMPWMWVKGTAHLVNSDIDLLKTGQFNIVEQCYKAWPIIYEFQRQMLGPKKWNIFWIIVMFSAIVYHRKIFLKSQMYITISLMLAISGYIFAYLIGQREIAYFVTMTWSRFMLHFLPLAVYWLALLFKELKLEI